MWNTIKVHQQTYKYEALPFSSGNVVYEATTKIEVYCYGEKIRTDIRYTQRRTGTRYTTLVVKNWYVGAKLTIVMTNHGIVPVPVAHWNTKRNFSPTFVRQNAKSNTILESRRGAVDCRTERQASMGLIVVGSYSSN